MAYHIHKTTLTNSKSGLQTSNKDHMPKRRKRHFNKMSLMLLIFVGCCCCFLTLILSPLHVQAKELYNTTSKGENMLNSDHQSHQHEENVELNINADKTNDNGTFQLTQQQQQQHQPTNTKIEHEEQTVEKDKELEEEEEETEDANSSEVIEMIQPPHALRHQEHYQQRILLGEKHKQQQQQHHHHVNENIDAHKNVDGNVDAAEVQERELSQYNRNLRYKQIQLALREPITFSLPHHHRRHEHHLVKQRLAKQTELTWPPQQQQQQQHHHLRHQHHQQQLTQEFQRHNNQPQMRHLKHEMRKQNITDTIIKPLLNHTRYFDRESSYINPFINMMPTEGPHLRHSASNLHWKSITQHNHLISDEEDNSQTKEEDIKRISLSLDGGVQETESNHKIRLDDENAGDQVNYDTDDTSDYSYEDDDVGDDSEEINKQNKYAAFSSISSSNPSIASSNIKMNVKRYTNPIKQQIKHKPSAKISNSYETLHNQYAGHHVKHTPLSLQQHNLDIMKTHTNSDNKAKAKEEEEEEKENDDDDDYDDIENNEEKNVSPTNTHEFANNEDDDGDVDVEDTNDNDDGDKMSDEKWNKIEHEHYRKQLQHQRDMQALRSRRPQMLATHTSTNVNGHKYTSHSSVASAYNNAWTKRQIVNDGESDNIYSRYYIPGSVTRKKEEELGSPAAILESRRQYALQQRQNKALASAHHRRIVTEGSCRLPQPRVERIRRDSWKIYTPHCTILHRCADDAGCCPSERQTCAPKRTKNVDLYFFVISLNETQGSIEKLSFVNHTECHCINRSRQRAPEYANSAANNNQIPYLRRATILNCFCPNLFEKILQEDGYCRCDCSSGNMGCDWLKRGMEHFSMNDRKCIIEGRCKLPTCEYGQYIKKHGRCPRREERHLSTDIDW